MRGIVIDATFYDWLRFGHILAGMVWVGGAVLLAAIAVMTVRGGDPGDVARFARSLRVLGPAVLAPATLTVLGLGIWLVLNSPAWGFGQAWVVVALALFAVAFVVGVAHQSRAAGNAQRAIDRDDATEARRQLTRWTWGYALVVALLVATAWDMVFKPGL